MDDLPRDNPIEAVATFTKKLDQLLEGMFS